MSTISSLNSALYSSLYGTQTQDPLALLQEAAAATQQQTPATTQQSTALQTNQNQLSGLNQLAAALQAFDTAMQGVQQQASSGNQADVTAAAQQFVDAYNKLASTLSNLTSSSGSLANDPLANDITRAIDNAESNAFSPSFGGLSGIGITRNGDGTLSFNASTLAQAFAMNGGETTSFVTQAAQSLDQVATQYTGSDGPIAAEQSTLTQEQTALQATGGSGGAAKTPQAIADYMNLVDTQLTSQVFADIMQQSLGTSDQTNSLPTIQDLAGQGNDPLTTASLLGTPLPSAVTNALNASVSPTSGGTAGTSSTGNPIFSLLA